jgi:hypothetical protein
VGNTAPHRPRLENWAVVGNYGSPYHAPEQMVTRLRGAVYGHGAFSEGKDVVTSAVVVLNVKSGYAVTSSGTIYALGRPAPEWLTWLSERGETPASFSMGGAS